MVVVGRVKNGVVVLEGDSALPEGAIVTVSYGEAVPSKSANGRSRIQVPLVKTGQPGSIDLTGERIAQVLNDEDAAT